MTSPVDSSRRTKTSSPSKRNSLGKRTAWLRPFLKSLAVLGAGADGDSAFGLVFVSFTLETSVLGIDHSIYHSYYRRRAYLPAGCFSPNWRSLASVAADWPESMASAPIATPSFRSNASPAATRAAAA